MSNDTATTNLSDINKLFLHYLVGKTQISKEEDFNEEALKVFNFQYANNKVFVLFYLLPLV